MTDNDKPRIEKNCKKCRGGCRGHNAGRELGASIETKMQGKKILWAMYDDKTIYPHNAKDAGDLTDEEIRQCLRNAMSSFEYRMLGVA
jgi:hypothetical protein